MRLRSKVSKRKLRSVGSKTCSPGALRYVLYSIRPTLQLQSLGGYKCRLSAQIRIKMWEKVAVFEEADSRI